MMMMTPQPDYTKLVIGQTSQKQQNQTLISHAIAIHVAATNMPLKCHMPKLHNCIKGLFGNMYLQHMNSLASTTYEECCTEKIIMPTLTLMMMQPTCIR